METIPKSHSLCSYTRTVDENVRWGWSWRNQRGGEGARGWRAGWREVAKQRARRCMVDDGGKKRRSSARRTRMVVVEEKKRG